MFSNFYFKKSCRLSDVGKYGTAGQATGDDTVHAPCSLDN